MENGTDHLGPVGEEVDGGQERGLRQGAADDAQPEPSRPHAQHEAEEDRHGDPQQVEGAEVDVRAQVLPPAPPGDARERSLHAVGDDGDADQGNHGGDGGDDLLLAAVREAHEAPRR